MPIEKVEDEVVLYLSEVPLEPEVPELPAVPVAPEEPLVPLEPDVPLEPFVPEDPLVPDVPLVPEEPSGVVSIFFNSPLVESNTTTLNPDVVVGKSGVNTLPENSEVLVEPVTVKEPDIAIS